MLSFIEFVSESEYRGSHKAPGPHNGAPMHDTSGVYPDDFHGPRGLDYYSGGERHDRESYSSITGSKGKPEKMVKIYRAVPKSTSGDEINKGDWVTPSKTYAKQHGRYFEDEGGAKILSKSVPAKHLYTDGNDVNEWGYHPDA